MARFIRNDRLADALHRQAQSALRAPPGARAHYDEQRDRGLDHNTALRVAKNDASIAPTSWVYLTNGSVALAVVTLRFNPRSIRWRRRAKPARPNICLLIIFVLLFTLGCSAFSGQLN